MPRRVRRSRPSQYMIRAAINDVAWVRYETIYAISSYNSRVLALPKAGRPWEKINAVKKTLGQWDSWDTFGPSIVFARVSMSQTHQDTRGSGTKQKMRALGLWDMGQKF